MRRFTHTFPQRISAFLLCLALCLGLLPVTALAVDGDTETARPATLVVGNITVITSQDGYWTTNSTTGGLTESSEAESWNVHYDEGTNTLYLNGATITASSDSNNNTSNAGIYATASEGQSVSLNIVLQGENNKVSGDIGIYVYSSSTGIASLTISSGDGSILTASGTVNPGIRVQNNGGDATLTIRNADVEAKVTTSGSIGVTVQAGSSSSASLTVERGSLTASGRKGIHFPEESPQLNISESAIVRASGGIAAGINENEPVTPSGVGIVFNDKVGTVYGSVELQENLTIGEGESLTLDSGASLDVGDYDVIVDGGTLDNGIAESLGNSVIYKVTKVELNKTSLTLAVGKSDTLTATITPSNATNPNVTWSSDDESVATVENGKVTAVGTGSTNITVTTADGSHTATCTVTVEKPYTPPPYIPPTYAVTVPDTTGGTVEVSPSRASSGRRVTITTQPAPGYELESLTVLDSRGSEIALTDQGDGKYTFTMPARKVTVQASFAPVPLPFEDVPPGAWYEEAVRYAYTHGIMEGMSDTTFVPGKSLTRAEAVQVLYNLEGQPTVSESATFPDLVYQWYKPAIAWAEQTGVVDGYEDGTFQPGDSITRQEFAQMLYNYAKYKGYDLTAEGDLSAFPDGDSVQEWALSAMSWANGNELINGHDDGTLEPGGTTTRAQAASILMRFDQKLVEN